MDKRESGPELDATLIPESLRDWVVDSAERISCHLEFIAASAIVAISGAIGRQFAVYPKRLDDWLVIPNLWGAIVSPPGTLKSPAMSAGFSILKDISKPLEAKKDLKIRVISNDPTVEKLVEILRDNPAGLMLYRDELSGWIEMAHRSGRQGEREFFLESWNGNSPYTMDRILRGSTIAEAVCLSIFGGILAFCSVFRF